MKTPVAIVENRKKIKDYLTNVIVKYCPYMEINWYYNSIKDFFNTSLGILPEIIFIDPEGISLEDLEIIKQKKLNAEFILILERDKPRSIPLNFFNPSGYLFYPLVEELVILTAECARRISELRKTQIINKPSLIQVGIPSSDGLDFVPINEIIRCESLTNCTRVITISSHRSIISSYNIGEFKKLLEGSGFYCPHKSHLINLLHIYKYKREGIILMKGDEKAVIPVSRNKRSEFMNLITRL
ncbi:MAG: LytTR family transcriptional regulator DNA-binding domain-containing protein [Saprospiraceae bacterium]